MANELQQKAFGKSVYRDFFKGSYRKKFTVGNVTVPVQVVDAEKKNTTCICRILKINLSPIVYFCSVSNEFARNFVHSLIFFTSIEKK